ncbi:MAG: ATP-binding protein [Pseudobdellovibrio sp.]
MQDFLVSILFSISSLIGLKQVPINEDLIWKIEKKWAKSDNGWELTATASNSQLLCKDGHSIFFPQVVHGVHSIKVDGNLILKTGDPSFTITSSFYQRPSLNCAYLKDSSIISWSVVTYSEYFARINQYPYIGHFSAKNYFFDVIINIVSSGCLILLALFSIFVFYKRADDKYVFSLFIGSLSFSIYSIMTTGNIFNIKLSMLTTHKLADIFIWIGALSYMYFFKNYKFLGKYEFSAFIGAFILGESLIIFGDNADVVQLGTTIPIPFAFLCLSSFLARSFYQGCIKGFNKNIILGIFSITLFVLAGMNDLLHITGLINSYMIMPIGSVAGVFFLAAAVNQNIEKTYLQRDDLLHTLEDKVIEKTKHLEEAMSALKSTQAELVQSAKLASLGTVSAGIAHEINNSINYVNGAIVPLERKVYSLIPESADKKMIEKLFAAIKEGTSLTVDIVKSLRSFTGLNQADHKEIKLADSIKAIQTILKSKLKNINFSVNIPDDCTIAGSLVGLNQIFMNLITNSIDALDKNEKSITINAYNQNGLINISIKDNGTGIPDQIIQKVFDPFFTTKEVGKGTGLGLHIVLKEVEKHKGKIKINSQVGVGTEFLITIPAYSDKILGEAA